MDEGNVGLLERSADDDKKLIDNPQKQIELRNKLREVHYAKPVKYSRGVAKEWKDLLPETHEELRDLLDSRVAEISNSKKDREENRNEIPDFVLGHEKNWESIGWPEDKRDAVKDKLRTVLKIKEDHAIQHAVECLVATGKTPDEILELVTEDNFNLMGEVAKSTGANATGNEHFQVPERDKDLAQQSLLLQKLGIPEHYIQRFILEKEYTDHSLRYLPGFERSLQEVFDGQLPENLYDLAWNVGFEKKELFGINGKFPVLQMQVKWEDEKDENDKPVIDETTGKAKKVLKGRYVVNEGNWIRWMRDHINWWYEEYDTDAVTDYFSKVEVKKGPFYSVNLVTMLYGYNRYFRDETGHLWQRLYDQTLLEPWMMSFQRAYALGYDDASQDEEQLANKLKELYHQNKLTRKIYNKSMIQILSTLPVDYKGGDSDTKIGEAFQKMFQAYYSMGDFEELQRTLGKDSDFFKKAGWDKAIEQVMDRMAKQTHVPQMENFLGERQDAFLEAFDDNGKIKPGKKNIAKFIDSINVFNDEPVSSNMGLVLQAALMNAVKETAVSSEYNTNSSEVKDSELNEDGKIYDDISLRNAWLLAHSWSYFSGGRARSNFPGVSGYLAETKWLYTDAYRMKYMTFGGAGNPFTVPMFKQLSIPLFEAILAENVNDRYVLERDHDGKPTKHGQRNKSAMEIFKQLRETSDFYEDGRKELRRQYAQAKATGNEGRMEEIRKRQDQIEDEAKNAYKILADTLEFKENAMRVYSKNVVGRAKTLYEQLMKSKETAFDKFITYDGLFRGPSFHREEWQAALQEKYFTPLRYLFEANRGTQLNQIVRAPMFIGKDEKGKPQWEWRDQYLGERMLGHQIVDIHDFWKEAKNIDPEKWKDMKKHGFRKRGEFVIRPDGKHEIDWNKVQDNKPMVYKQWMLMKLSADLWSHITRHSTDPTYTLEHYEDIVDAIKSLPGNIGGDEFNMKGVRVTDTLFSKHQMHWLEKISGKNGLFFRTFMQDIFMGDKRKKESMFGETATIFVGAVFRGYG